MLYPNWTNNTKGFYCAFDIIIFQPLRQWRRWLRSTLTCWALWLVELLIVHTGSVFWPDSAGIHHTIQQYINVTFFKNIPFNNKNHKTMASCTVVVFPINLFFQCHLVNPNFQIHIKSLFQFFLGLAILSLLKQQKQNKGFVKSSWVLITCLFYGSVTHSWNC